MMEILRTERLRLRTVQEEDANFYLELVNDPDFIEHIGDRGLRTVEDARRASSRLCWPSMRPTPTPCADGLTM